MATRKKVAKENASQAADRLMVQGTLAGLSSAASWQAHPWALLWLWMWLRGEGVLEVNPELGGGGKSLTGLDFDPQSTGELENS